MVGTVEVKAEDVAAGEAVYQKVCRNCHGRTAKGVGAFPRLVGQSAEDLETKLKKYRSGDKVGPNTALMAPHAAKLSDDDIANIASYVSTTFN